MHDQGVLHGAVKREGVSHNEGQDGLAYTAPEFIVYTSKGSVIGLKDQGWVV